MKTLLYITLTLFGMAVSLNAASDTIKTTTTHTYVPSQVTVSVGDEVTINASTFHPLVQVSKETWDTGGATPLAGGWGVKTTPYNFIATKADTIYFVCQAHVMLGMKGMIIVLGFADVSNLSLGSMNFALYPNPVSSKGTLVINSENQSNITARIFDNTGKLVNTLSDNINVAEGDNRINMDVSGLENGNYLIVATDNRKQYVLKMVVLK